MQDLKHLDDNYQINIENEEILLSASREHVPEKENNDDDKDIVPNDSSKKLSDQLSTNLKTVRDVLKQVTKKYKEATPASNTVSQPVDGLTDDQLQEDSLNPENQSHLKEAANVNLNSADINVTIQHINEANEWQDYSEEDIKYIDKLALFFQAIKYDKEPKLYEVEDSINELGII